MNYDNLSRDLVRALRGARSQRALGKRLRFTSNVIYAWESGRRQPTSSVFFKLVATVKPAFGARFGERLWGGKEDPLSTSHLATPEGVGELVRRLAQEQPVSALARAVGVDRTTITRWLKGRSEPRLGELLALIEVTSLRLLDVVELLADPGSLPSVRKRYRALQAQRRLAFEVPFSHAVLRALELVRSPGAPNDDVAFVAGRTGIALDEARALLRELAAAGQIKRRRGHYELADVMTIDTRGDDARNVRLKRHWAEVALARIDEYRLHHEALASYNVFAASNKALERIRKLQLDYYDQVRRIVSADGAPDRVVLLNMQLFPLDA